MTDLGGSLPVSGAFPEDVTARLRFITDAAPVLISYVDPEFRYRFVNRAYVDWFGRPAEEVVGRTVAEVVGEAAFAAIRPYLAEALAGRRTTYEAVLAYDTGPRHVHVDYVPDFAPADPAGKDGDTPGRGVRGAVAVVTDLTGQRATEARLRASESARRASEAHLDLALEAAALGAWSFDPASGVAVASDRVRRLFGAESDEAPADFWFSRLHPEDRGRVETGFLAAVTGERAYDEQFRVVWPGGVRWVRARGRLVDGHGDPPRLIGVAEDVTERVEAEREREALLAESREAAARQRALLREVLTAVTDGVLRLCDTPTDLPEGAGVGSDVAASVPLTAPTALKALRREVERVAAACGLPEDRVSDLLTAASEAAMNVVTHAAGRGEGRVRCDPGQGRVRVWVTDAGTGIPLERLHRAVLERGFSTADSLGHGFWLMLRTADRVYLLTGPAGTTVVVEKGKTAPRPDWLRDNTPGGAPPWPAAPAPAA